MRPRTLKPHPDLHPPCWEGIGDDMAELASACQAAGSTVCDFRTAREEATGPDADDATKAGRPAYKAKADDGEAKRRGAKALIRRARRACKDNAGSNKYVVACIKRSVAANGIAQCGVGASSRIEARHGPQHTPSDWV